MNKSDFINDDQPFILVVSFDPVSNTCLHTYFQTHLDSLTDLNRFRTAFPNHFHFSTRNKAALSMRSKEMFGESLVGGGS